MSDDPTKPTDPRTPKTLSYWRSLSDLDRFWVKVFALASAVAYLTVGISYLTPACILVMIIARGSIGRGDPA
jgi:hypothetical protein